MIYRWKVGALAAASACALAAGAAAAADLTVTSFGGAYQDAQRKVYFEPFKQATGLDLVEDVWNGGVGAIRAKVEGGGQEWDVVQVEAEELVIGCEEGLYEPIDWEALGGKDQFIEAAVDDCGVGTIVWSTAHRLRRRQDHRRTRRRAGPISGTPRNTRASAGCVATPSTRSSSR